MIDLRIDTSSYAKVAASVGYAVDQVPYALSRALNDAAFATKKRLTEETWPSSMTVRNKSFLRAALRIKRSDKYDLSVSIYDKLGRAHLFEHATGGTKRAANRHLAIPVGSWVRIGAHGVSVPQRPRNLIARTPKRNLRITDKGIFVGEHGRLQLRYVFKSSVQIKRDVPFREDFAKFMTDEVNRAFPIRLHEAMQNKR